MDFSERQLTLDGSRYEIAWVTPPAMPAADPPTVVLLHEGLGCVALWRDFPARLTTRLGLPVLLYSRLGYGRSDPGRRPLPLDYHVTEAVNVLPKLLAASGVRRPILLGHSDGGTIALINAAATVLPRPLAVISIAAHVFVEDITIRGIEKTKAAFTTTNLRSRLAAYHGDNVDQAFWGWCDAWLSPPFRGWNVEAWLPSIRCPLLVMQGEADEYGSPRQVEAIVAGSGGAAEAALLAGRGHVPHLDDPDAVITRIGDFFSRYGVIG